MAKVTYRGVQYDTETRQKETKQSQKQLVYRGVAVPVSYTHLTLPTILLV